MRGGDSPDSPCAERRLALKRVRFSGAHHGDQACKLITVPDKPHDVQSHRKASSNKSIKPRSVSLQSDLICLTIRHVA